MSFQDAARLKGVRSWKLQFFVHWRNSQNAARLREFAAGNVSFFCALEEPLECGKVKEARS